MMAERLIDPVGVTSGAREIGFTKSDHPNCSSILFENLDRNPDKLAVLGPLGEATYAQLCAQACQWGNAFAAFGLFRGERIAFLLDDSAVFPAAFFGATRAGFVPVLLNTLTKPEELNYFLRDSDARVAVCDAEFLDRFTADASAGTRLDTVIAANGPAPEDKPLPVAAQQFIAGMETHLRCADTDPDDMAFWMYSSGSTGRPKGIVHLHHDMAYTAQSFGRSILKLKPDDVCYSVPKAFFAYGFGNSLTFPFSVGATSLLVPGRPAPERVVGAIEEYRPTVFFGLPTLYTAICNMPDATERDFSSLRQCMSAAEILSEEIFSAWRQLTGTNAVEGLGSTEMLHVYLSNSIDEQRLGSAGKPVTGYEVELRTADGAPAAAGEEGVMWVRGTSSALCYWNRPDKTAETMRGDWIYTGDRFEEKDGYFYFKGRADDLVKVSGQWVWPMEVEQCLNEHPHVHECAVLAHQLPDQRVVLKAIVSLKSGQADDEGQVVELKNHVKTALLPFKAPRMVLFLEELPKTGTGKIDRQALVGLGDKAV